MKGDNNHAFHIKVNVSKVKIPIITDFDKTHKYKALPNLTQV
jgi:hypothetical protein